MNFFYHLRGVLCIICILADTLFRYPLLIIFAFIRLIPFKPTRYISTKILSRIPFLKFFLKEELLWVPLMGFAWWALDFPFMKRYSSEFIKNNPHLKGKDIEITKKACEKFRTMPVSIMNFGVCFHHNGAAD